MNHKSIIIIVFIVLVSLIAVSNALHVYENGNITLEEHHDHDGQGHDSNHNESEDHNHTQEHNESQEHTQEHAESQH